MSYNRGQCLICFRLAKEDSASVLEPERLFILAPLVSYFPAYYCAINDHFSDYVTNNSKGSRDVTISLFDSSDLAPLVWHYPVGVLLDLVGHRGGESARLDVVVRFREAKVYGDHFIEPRSPELFGSLFLNQLKVALSVRGKGLSQFNILPKDETDILQSLAGGGNHVNLDAFFGVLDSIFATPTKVAAVKLYLALEGQIHTRVASVAFEAETTVSQLVSNLGVEGSGLKIWTQGVCLHGETPVEFLQQQCVYADGFVHLVTVL